MGGYEGYISIASYDDGYVNFLNDVSTADFKGFMTMTEYGPFDLQVFNQLRQFLVYIAILMTNPMFESL